MKIKAQQIWVGKDLMIEVDKDGFCMWKMLKTGKKYEKDYWIIDGSTFNNTREIDIYNRAKFDFGKEFTIKVEE